MAPLMLLVLTSFICFLGDKYVFFCINKTSGALYRDTNILRFTLCPEAADAASWWNQSDNVKSAQSRSLSGFCMCSIIAELKISKKKAQWLAILTLFDWSFLPKKNPVYIFSLSGLWKWRSMWILSGFKVFRNFSLVCNLDFRFSETDFQLHNSYSQKLYGAFR